MFTLIIGGAGSGKSAYAERLVCARPGPWLYIATMEPFGDEARDRIARHRAMREGKGAVTMERYTDLAGAELPADANALLEDLSNLLANEMFRPDGRGPSAALFGVLSALDRCDDLTVVTNEVFSGGAGYEKETIAYLRELAHLNRTLAARADRVIEVVCGLPNVLKGERPCL